jgi:hypothetical protein
MIAAMKYGMPDVTTTSTTTGEFYFYFYYDWYFYYYWYAADSFDAAGEPSGMSGWTEQLRLA